MCSYKAIKYKSAKPVIEAVIQKKLLKKTILPVWWIISKQAILEASPCVHYLNSFHRAWDHFLTNCTY